MPFNSDWVWYTYYIWFVATVIGAWAIISLIQCVVWGFKYQIQAGGIVLSIFTIIYTGLFFIGFINRILAKEKSVCIGLVVITIIFLALYYATLGEVKSEPSEGWASYYVKKAYDKGSSSTVYDLLHKLLTTGACLKSDDGDKCVKQNVENSFAGIMAQMIIISICYIIAILLILRFPNIYAEPVQYTTNNVGIDNNETPNIELPTTKPSTNSSNAYTPSSQINSNYSQPSQRNSNYIPSNSNISTSSNAQSRNYPVEPQEKPIPVTVALLDYDIGKANNNQYYAIKPEKNYNIDTDDSSSSS